MTLGISLLISGNWSALVIDSHVIYKCSFNICYSILFTGQGETNVNTEFGCGAEILKFALYNVTSKCSINLLGGL